MRIKLYSVGDPIKRNTHICIPDGCFVDAGEPDEEQKEQDLRVPLSTMDIEGPGLLGDWQFGFAIGILVGSVGGMIALYALAGF